MVVTVTRDATVGDVVAELTQHRIGALVVSPDGQRIEGIVSERDIVKRHSVLNPAAAGRGSPLRQPRRAQVGEGYRALAHRSSWQSMSRHRRFHRRIQRLHAAARRRQGDFR